MVNLPAVYRSTFVLWFLLSDDVAQRDVIAARTCIRKLLLEHRYTARRSGLEIGHWHTTCGTSIRQSGQPSCVALLGSVLTRIPYHNRYLTTTRAYITTPQAAAPARDVCHWQRSG